MHKTPKPYTADKQATPVAAEPAAVYGRTDSHTDEVLSSFQPVSKPGRMTVDEYFDELWTLYLKKRENIQS